LQQTFITNKKTDARKVCTKNFLHCGWCILQSQQLRLKSWGYSGRGSVDFKISKGYKKRILVEIKYSGNSHLKNGYENQIEEYNKAEKTQESIYLIIRTTNSKENIIKIQDKELLGLEEGKKMPKVMVTDGRLKPSASKSPKKKD